MNHALSALLLLTCATTLPAQEPDAAAPPSPKTAQHARLKTLAGLWRTESTMSAMPGSGEKETRFDGFERADLVCDGLWLVVRSDSTCEGVPSSGLWMVGYDPYGKNYPGFAVANMDNSFCSFEGRYDEKAKTWHFQGLTPMGRFRSDLVVESADRTVETVYSVLPDGKDLQFMRIVRTRVEKVPARTEEPESQPTGTEDSGSAREPAPEELALRSERGHWLADFRMEMRGVPPMLARCEEVVEPICFGTWNWSTFTGELMGGPFEGHALTGYSRETDEVVSVWIDSMSPCAMRTAGKYDEESKAFSLNGTCYTETGSLDPVASSVQIPSRDQRRMRIVFGRGDGHSVLTIAYTRKAD